MKKYNSPKEIGIGDVVTIDPDYFANSNHTYIKPDGRIGIKTASSDTKYMVLINLIKGETDVKGFTPKNNRTILIDDDGNRTTVYDYSKLTVARKV
tara:strand:+ start:79 stop:366 length:288 start_codon:yes stop_codon:yes gene_type:complete